MGGFRLLDLVKFIVPILPEVETTTEVIPFDEKIVFTIGGALIFLLGQIPLYGLSKNASTVIADPFFNLRPIFAMEKGTLLELGLLPLITSAFLWQLAAGLKLIKVNFNLAGDRDLFQSAQKLTSFFLGVVFAVGLTVGGYYDNAIQGGVTSGSIPYILYGAILLQVIAWNFFLTLIVEVFDKDYAFGGGIGAFLIVQVGAGMVKDMFGLDNVLLPNSNKYESHGVLYYMVMNIRLLPTTVLNVFNRVHLPNFYQLYLIILSALVVIYLQSVRYPISIRSSKVRGVNNVFPVKLLYTGSLPVLFSYTLLANLQVFGYIVSKLVKIPYFATWTVILPSNTYVLTSGALSYIIPNSGSILESVLAPIKSMLLVSVVILSSIWFGSTWSEISGSSAKDVAKEFKTQGITLPGKRDISVAKELSVVISSAAKVGAATLGTIAIATDLCGGAGKATAVIIGLTLAFSVLEEFMTEYQRTGGNSQFTGVFGQ